MLPNAVKGVWASLSIQLTVDWRWYPFIGERAWFIHKQSSVDVGVQILLVNRKVSQMPSIPLGSDFARLRTADEPENRST